MADHRSPPPDAAAPGTPRFVATADAGAAIGSVVVVDVLRAFTTAAYAFAAGARHVYLVGTVAEALEFKAANPGTLAMGEEHGRRPDGFDFANSPAQVAAADLRDRVHRPAHVVGDPGRDRRARRDPAVVRRAGHRLGHGSGGPFGRSGRSDLRHHRLVQHEPRDRARTTWRRPS